MLPDSRLLDAGCGSGELAKGFSPYVGEVVAIDKSEEMLNAARESAPENVVFRKGGVGDLDVGRFDAIAAGRALCYMPRETTIRYFENVLPAGGAVATCTAVITSATSWKKKLDDVRRRYGYRPDAFAFKDTKYFAATCFKYVNTVHTKSHAYYTLDSLVDNALAYRSSYENICSNMRQFRVDLEDALGSYQTADGSLEAVIGCAALVFRKS